MSGYPDQGDRRSGMTETGRTENRECRGSLSGSCLVEQYGETGCARGECVQPGPGELVVGGHRIPRDPEDLHRYRDAVNSPLKPSTVEAVAKRIAAGELPRQGGDT